jgi:hypothetical protein
MRAGELVETQDVRSYFKENLVELVDQHGMEVGDDVVAYVTNLLTAFVRAEHFYEWSPQGPTLTPLAMLYAEVVNTPSTKYKQQLLQRMGDVALFVAGVFAESFHRKSYDVDYYIDMGAAAYGSLSDSMDAQSRMFAELSACFADFVQVLGEISDPSNLQDDRDIVKLYQLWLRTGSRHAAKMLERAGINVINPSNRTQH